MESSLKQHNVEQAKPGFDIKPVIEQKPFESPPVRRFFAKWCEINDSIQPQIVSRDDWEQRGEKGILEKRPDNKKTLFIPKDLQLWEMIGVLEVVENDTFIDKPERQGEAKEKILQLGKTFRNAGVYIAQRLDCVNEGKSIASNLAEDFYQYGQSLETGKKSEEHATVEDIAKLTLTPEETEAVDHFLAGDSLYESRQARAEKLSITDPLKRDEFYEAERRRTLGKFFKATEKAFELKGKSERGELQKSKADVKPWQRRTPVHSAFVAKSEKGLTQQIETPKRELEDSFFRRGLEKVKNEMTQPGWGQFINFVLERHGFDYRVGEKKIIDSLGIKQLRTELEILRQSGDVSKISAKERKIADKIQAEINSLPRHDANNPSEILANQYINCLGASILGGALMREAGLNYLLGDLPRHSILLLVTSDGHVEWRDMQKPSHNEILTDKMIGSRRKDGSTLTVSDIVEFSKKPQPEGLMLDFDNRKYRRKLPWVKKGERQYVTMFAPEYGQKIQLLNNTGIALSKLGLMEEAIEAYREAIALDPKYPHLYSNLGIDLKHLGRNEEAIEAYREAIALDPKDAKSYNRIGDALSELGDNEKETETYRQRLKEEAIEAYREAIALDPNYSHPHFNLGSTFYELNRDSESIEEYQKFIRLADKNKDYWLINEAEEAITELKNEA